MRLDQQRFNDVLELLPAYLILLTPDHRVPFANRFFRERFGESQGRRCYDFLFGRSEPCEVCESFEVLKTGKFHEWLWNGPDGRSYHILDLPFTDADGSTIVMEMGIDITKYKKAEEDLQKVHDVLEARVKEQTAELNQELAQRQQAEEELLKSHEELELRVRERTADLEKLNEALRAEIEERKRADEIISRQAQEILEVSTPVIQIWEGIVTVPLIGTLDSRRTQQLMEQLLQKIVETSSLVALIDVTGVPTIDSRTAQYLIETISAVHLLGAEVVLTGIRPEIARTLVQLGTDLSNVNTRSSFSAGLLFALNLLKLQVVKQASTNGHL